LASELACAGERAEEVGGAFVHEPAGCAVGIYCHPANGVHGQLALRRVPCTHGGEESDGLANVAQRFAAALTHDLIARMVGAHRTSVTVALRKLAEEGRITRERRRWTLLGPPPPQDLSDISRPVASQHPE
jgi:hypothetical protein